MSQPSPQERPRRLTQTPDHQLTPRLRVAKRLFLSAQQDLASAQRHLDTAREIRRAAAQQAKSPRV